MEPWIRHGYLRTKSFSKKSQVFGHERVREPRFVGLVGVVFESKRMCMVPFRYVYMYIFHILYTIIYVYMWILTMNWDDEVITIKKHISMNFAVFFESEPFLDG